MVFGRILTIPAAKYQNPLLTKDNVQQILRYFGIGVSSISSVLGTIKKTELTRYLDCSSSLPPSRPIL